MESLTSPPVDGNKPQNPPTELSNCDGSTPLLNSKSDEKVLFEPDDPAMARCTQHGVWDHWEDISRGSTSLFKLQVPHAIAAKLKVPTDVYKGWPSVRRMIADMATVEGSTVYFAFYLFMKLFGSILPSLELWYNSQFLRMIEATLETRSVDKDALLHVAGGQVIVSILKRAIESTGAHFDRRFEKRVGRTFASRAFQLAARLDVLTHGDSSVRETIESLYYFDENPLLRGSRSIVQVFSDLVNFATQCGVLFSVLSGHYESAKFLIVVGVLRLLYDIAVDAGPSRRHMYNTGGAYALKTMDDDFLQLSGLHEMVTHEVYRKDLVAGGLSDTLSQQYDRRLRNLGDKPTKANSIIVLKGFDKVWQIILDHAESPFDVFCQLYTCLQVANSSSSTPFSLSTLHLVTSTVSSLNAQLSSLGQSIEGISWEVERICKYYNTVDMPNRIADGTIPFPENEFDFRNGISVEFKNVCFKYPGGTGLNVIKNLSFKIEQGQLCVVVGENGSGKSTILTLLTRIYDITEGQILLNGHDIRTLRLADVRKAVAVLHQEYTIFPLPFAQNIGLGDPHNAENMDKIRQAAQLGGASEFIEELPHKYGTYLSRPVSDHWNPEPSKHSTYAGKEFDFKKLNLNEGESDLSGGQKQRIALSRTFMKSVVASGNIVGLLLFDEPSAALDPKAEHDLFTRLRNLRGSKTMIFSSHRFGKLTRHADLILYIAKGELMEAGNHVELMKKDGEYAKFWNMQVEDFLS